MSGYSGFQTDDYIYKPKGGFSGTFGSSDFKYESESGTSKWQQGAKTFLDAFAKGLENRNQYRQQAQSTPTFGPASKDGAASGIGTGGLSGELTFVPSGGSPMGGITIPGQPGEPGIGQKIAGTALSIGAGALTGGWGGAAAGALTGAANFF